MCKKSFESYQLLIISKEGTEQKTKGMVLLSLFSLSGMKHGAEHRIHHLPTLSLDPKFLP